MRRLVLLLAFLPTGLIAQHCGYDFSSIIVVRPHAAEDSAVIHGLRITLLDSNNVPVVHRGAPWSLFHRNERAPFCGYVRYKGPINPYFPFAEDNYVLVVPNSFRTEKMKVLVQDERDAGPLKKRRRASASEPGWPVRYQQVVVPLTAFDSYALCGDYDEEVYPPMDGRPNFAPVDITLYPR